MTFDGDRLDCDELALGGTLHIVIVELAGTKVRTSASTCGRGPACR
jgi:hypothetical protein